MYNHYLTITIILNWKLQFVKENISCNNNIQYSHNNFAQKNLGGVAIWLNVKKLCAL